MLTDHQLWTWYCTKHPAPKRCASFTEITLKPGWQMLITTVIKVVKEKDSVRPVRKELTAKNWETSLRRDGFLNMFSEDVV